MNNKPLSTTQKEKFIKAARTFGYWVKNEFVFLREFKRKWVLFRKRRQFQLSYDQAYDAFEKDIEETKDCQKQLALADQRHFECSEYTDEIQRLDSLELIRRAERCFIDVYDFSPSGEYNELWDQGRHGTLYLHQKIFRNLSKAVEIAEYERAKRNFEQRDFWLKIFTAGFAAFAAVASGINLVRKW